MLRRAVRAILIFAAVLLAAPVSAGAATLSVTTTSDPASPSCPSASNCSLRGAVAAAGEGGLVTLPAGTYLLTQGDVFVDTGLTIRGAGSASTIVDASGSSNARAFRIRGVVTQAVTIEGLEVTGGDTTDSGGGISHRTRSPLTLKDVRVSGNSSTTSGSNAGGGGVWSVGTVRLIDSTIADNTTTVTGARESSGGGGIFITDGSSSNLVMTGSSITGNAATVDSQDFPSTYPSAPSALGGGGVYAGGSGLQMRQSTVSENTVTVTGSLGESGGGGIYVASDALDAIDSTVSGNTASVTASPNLTTDPYYASNDGGGGIFQGGTNVTLAGTRVEDNTATALNSYGESGGGGVYVASRDWQSGNPRGDLTVSGGGISRNSATVTATTDPNRVASNAGGGGIYQDSLALSLNEATLVGNATVVHGEASAAIGDSTNGGGAIYMFGTSTSISGSTVSANSATLPASNRSGGGGLFDNGNADFITNSTFQGNTANVGPSPDQTGGEPNGGGGIMWVTVRDGIWVANATIAGNSAPQAAGGGVLAYRNPELGGTTQIQMGNSIFEGNSASLAGTASCQTSSAAITSLGFNLADSGATACALTADGDRTGSAGLGALRSNGGPTKTMAVGAASPAVTGGNPDGCSSAQGGHLDSDQRAVTRPPLPVDGVCDTGAYQLAPPTAVTGAATVLGSSAATVDGTASNPDAQAGTTKVEYGTTSAYGSSTTPTSLAAYTPSSAVTRTLSSLKPSTTYHYRLVTTNAVGSATGADRTFKTSSAPSPSDSFTIRSITVAGSTIRSRVAVPGKGRITQVGTRYGGSGSQPACSTERKVIKADTYLLSCALNAATRRARRHGPVRVLLRTTFTPTGGTARTLNRIVTLSATSGGITG